MIQIKAVEDEVHLTLHRDGEPDSCWQLGVREAVGLLNNMPALRDAIAQASGSGKEARRRKIEELEHEVKRLKALDAPSTLSPQVMVGRPILREGK